MRIGIVTPAPPDSRYGNRITALRWAKILRGLGNRVSISQTYDGEPYDLLLALHARRSHKSIDGFRRQNTQAPVIVALTGTDLYRDIRANHLARQSLEIATRIVVLQPKALEELRPSLQDKTRVIYQSVEATREPASGGVKPRTRNPDRRERFSGNFDVCVIGHLRTVKDPFRAAMAARLLPRSSRIRVLQVGKAMTDTIAARARKEVLVNHRYEWLGEQPRSEVRRILAKSRLCVLSSRMEGGANVLSEAIVASVPILASHIDGNIGILGEEYPGYFGVCDTEELVQLMTRSETCPEYLADLSARVTNLAPLFSPPREEQAWADLICELSG
ncbi:MAG TPA: selenoneine biosynthesis selenosugar synthase SenB [Pyrinomonadaceae bacterium]|nr:selenoneine biosynthesis selenosugar synthase SenB [Pyrinomonadaceae bacterium]